MTLAPGPTPERNPLRAGRERRRAGELGSCRCKGDAVHATAAGEESFRAKSGRGGFSASGLARAQLS